MTKVQQLLTAQPSEINGMTVAGFLGHQPETRTGLSSAYSYLLQRFSKSFAKFATRDLLWPDKMKRTHSSGRFCVYVFHVSNRGWHGLHGLEPPRLCNFAKPTPDSTS